MTQIVRMRVRANRENCPTVLTVQGQVRVCVRTSEPAAGRFRYELRSCPLACRSVTSDMTGAVLATVAGMTKPGLSLLEHSNLGQVLADIARELVQRDCQVANAYPRASIQARKLSAATEALNAARAALDSALAQEHPNEFSPEVYYPTSRD